MRIILSREVYSDLESIMEYYLTIAGPHIAAEFYKEFLICRNLIANRPKSFPVIRKNIRRINFEKFPYHILFQITDQQSAKVLIVKHDRRDPSHGSERT